VLSPSKDQALSLFDVLASAAATPCGITFVSGNEREHVSYASLAASMPSLASAFSSLAPPPSPVLLVLPNGRALVEAFFGAIAAGLVPAILPPLRPFGDAKRWSEALVRVAKVADDATIVTTDALAPIVEASSSGSSVRVVAFSALDRSGTCAVRPGSGQDIGLLQFTSGSLGDPKGVCLSHDAVVSDALAIRDRLRIGADDAGCFWVPLAHDMALVSFLMILAAGVDLTMMPTDRFAISPASWLELCAERATLTVGPPFAFELAARRLLRAGKAVDLSRLRACVVGGEPIHAGRLREVSKMLAPFGLPTDVFMPAYGLAENVCVATMGGPSAPFPTKRLEQPLASGARITLARSDDTRALEVVGHGPTLEHQSIRIVDGEGGALPDRTIGHVQISGRARMLGYHRAPEATAQAFDGVWLRTGDLGFLDEGFLYVCGRHKDVIIVRGRQLFPEEIEAVVLESPSLRPRGAVVFGTMRADGEDEVVTLVAEAAVTDDLAALEKELVRRVADAVDLVIARVCFVAPGAIPRTTSGKPRRGESRRLWGSP
jgi:fatty-acyl-CoA synthase